MIRLALWQIVLLVLPFVLYWGYVVLIAKKRAESGGVWNDAPITWLLTAGIVMAVASLVYWGLSRELEDDQSGLSNGVPAVRNEGQQEPSAEFV